MAPELHPDVWSGQEKFQMTNFTLPNNISFMKCAPKSVPGLVLVGAPPGDRVGWAGLHPDGQRDLERIANEPPLKLFPATSI